MRQLLACRICELRAAMVTGTDLKKIKPAQIPALVGVGSWGPVPSLRAISGCWSKEDSTLSLGSVNGCWIKDNSFPSLGAINNGGWSKGGSVPIWGAISGTWSKGEWQFLEVADTCRVPSLSVWTPHQRTEGQHYLGSVDSSFKKSKSTQSLKNLSWSHGRS